MTLRERLGVFGYRDFALYWSGGLLSNVGTWLQNVSASVFMYALTGDPLMVGVLNFAAFLPILLFSLFGGVVSDRFDRRRVIVTTHLASMAIVLGIAAVTFMGTVQPWMLIAGAFVTTTSYAFAKPSLMSLLPALVPRERLAEATGLNILQFTGGQVGGSVLAAVVLAVGTRLSGQASSETRQSSTTSAALPSVERSSPVSTTSLAPSRLMVSRSRSSSSVSPL